MRIIPLFFRTAYTPQNERASSYYHICPSITSVFTAALATLGAVAAGATLSAALFATGFATTIYTFGQILRSKDHAKVIKAHEENNAKQAELIEKHVVNNTEQAKLIENLRTVSKEQQEKMDEQLNKANTLAHSLGVTNEDLKGTNKNLSDETRALKLQREGLASQLEAYQLQAKHVLTSYKDRSEYICQKFAEVAPELREKFNVLLQGISDENTKQMDAQLNASQQLLDAFAAAIQAFDTEDRRNELIGLKEERDALKGERKDLQDTLSALRAQSVQYEANIKGLQTAISTLESKLQNTATELAASAKATAENAAKMEKTASEMKKTNDATVDAVNKVGVRVVTALSPQISSDNLPSTSNQQQTFPAQPREVPVH